MSTTPHERDARAAARRRAFAEGYGSVAGIFAAPPPPPMPPVRVRASLAAASADTLGDLAAAFRDVPRPNAAIRTTRR